MKHLRKFNENNSSFYKITSSDKKWLDLEPLSEVEKSVLKDYVQKQNWKILPESRHIYHAIPKLIMVVTDGFQEFSISKYGDEWFFVKNAPNPHPIELIEYKCDQIDGVIDCLDYLKDKNRHKK